MRRDIGIRQWKLSRSPIMLTDPEILWLFVTAVYTHTQKSWFIVQVDGTQIRKCRHSSRWKYVILYCQKARNQIEWSFVLSN